jgi:lysyl-tRNA synthetase class 2
MPSSVIRRFRYKDRVLEIEFVSGRRYRYLDVPAAVYREMCNSRSKGEFFNARIRNRFSFRRISA